MTAELRATLVRGFKRALASFDFAALTRAYVESQSWPERVALIAAGKGAVAMATGARRALERRITEALVVCPDGAEVGDTDTRAALPDNPMSADRVRWEHIQRVYELCSRNVSETARRLNMHRRTLQRILAKRAPK